MRGKCKKIRWLIYNKAFKIFGNTKWWPRLGFMIWR